VEAIYLGWTNSMAAWSLGPVEDAFVFPSFTLAFRYALAIMGDRGLSFMPKAAPELSAYPAFNGHSCRGCGCTELFACPNECSWVEPNVCSECEIGSNHLAIWTIYVNPIDMPGMYVARQSLSGVQTETVLQHKTLDGLRALLPDSLCPIPRMDGDPENVVETWM
jgi:hypothetical protein